MAVELEISTQARQDIEDAVDFYSLQQASLGERFYDQLRKELDTLPALCEGFQRRYHNVRCMPVDGFPFMVHYTLIEKTIIVLALIHTSQSPDAIRDKVEKAIKRRSSK